MGHGKCADSAPTNSANSIEHDRRKEFAVLRYAEKRYKIVKNIHVDDNQGPIADITTFAALSSDPVILLDLPKKGQSVRIHAKDSLGLEFFSFKKNNTM